ncbi:MAG TPA: class I SAM-dependent methyltransferase [Candidatus Paceibacterota bacterium]|nr:class I SAM-dependent methyltransferase [Candidatus Paceibacterota bacterium]
MESSVLRMYTHTGRRISATDGEIIYNLGCGNQHYPGVIGVDVRPSKTVDLVCNLNRMPWPIESGTADAVLAFHTLEHLADLNAVMTEIFRVLKPGGHLVVEVPYFRHPGAFQDPTHIHFFTSRTMSYFCENEKRAHGRYGAMRFREIGTWLGWPAPARDPFVRAAKSWINRHKDFYDLHLATFFPVPILVAELEAVK